MPGPQRRGTGAPGADRSSERGERRDRRDRDGRGRVPGELAADVVKVEP